MPPGGKLDEQVSAEAWKAAVPVRVVLAEREVLAHEQPAPLYFLVQRHAFLHCLVPDLLPFYVRLLPPGDDAPWFEHEGLPLKWGVPAGVLYDLVARPGEAPWELTVHFRGFPVEALPAYRGEASLRAAFFNSLKEAAFIATGSSRRVMDMLAGASDELWRAVLRPDAARYARVAGALALAPAAVAGRGAAVPLRLFVRRGGRGAYVASYGSVAYTSRPVGVQHADGSSVSLRDALLPLLRELQQGSAGGGQQRSTQQQRQQPAAEASAGASSSGADGGDAPGPAASAAVPSDAPDPGAGPARGSGDGGAADAPEIRECSVLVGGIDPPWDAPLAWLHARLHAPDYFLYVVAHVTS